MHVSVLGELIRTIVALGVVIVSVGLLARLARRRAVGLARSASATGGLLVVQRQVLAKGVQLLVVQVGTRRLLIGATAQQVSLLGEVDDQEAYALGSAQAGEGLQMDLRAVDLKGLLASRSPGMDRQGVSGLRSALVTDGIGGPRMASYRGQSPARAWMSERLEELRQLTVRHD
ncbi:MAG: flagellar biosynthetic protein FliO [Actinobacteria bacterium]|nr:flagellar biosynthetic protein FliO [Actinomycetota bacterium]